MSLFLKYFFLTITIGLSFYIIKDYSWAMPPEEISRGFLLLISPGILFTVYLIILLRAFLTPMKSVLIFFALLMFYLIALFYGYTALGLYVPILSGLGAYIVSFLFNLRGRPYIIVGLSIFSSIVGLILFLISLTSTKWSIGTYFGITICLWQLVVGIVCIHETEPTQ